MPMILAIEALETSFPSCSRISCSLPSSLDVPGLTKTQLPFDRGRGLGPGFECQRSVDSRQHCRPTLEAPAWKGTRIGLIAALYAPARVGSGWPGRVAGAHAVDARPAIGRDGA
jgi:hypothetical protein